MSMTPAAAWWRHTQLLHRFVSDLIHAELYQLRRSGAGLPPLPWSADTDLEADLGVDSLERQVLAMACADFTRWQARLGARAAAVGRQSVYSSLSSLHLLPVDTVKIDRSFVTLSATSRHHEVLIEATVKVARSLGMNTVAEGIETPEQAALITAQGCSKGQGYLYRKSISAEAIEAWLAETAA